MKPTSYARRNVRHMLARKERAGRNALLSSEAASVKTLAEGIVHLAQTGRGGYTIHPSTPDSTDVRDSQGRPIVFISPSQPERGQPTRDICVYGYRGDHKVSVSITDGSLAPHLRYDSISLDPKGEIAQRVKRYLPKLPTEPNEMTAEIRPRGKEH